MANDDFVATDFMLRMMRAFSTQQHGTVKGVDYLAKELDVGSLSCLLLVPLLPSIFKTQKMQNLTVL